MKEVNVEVMVERIMLNANSYVLFAARHEDGQYVRVKSLQHIDPEEGEMYRISGKEWHRRDEHGRLWRQIDADNIERIRQSGALIGNWLARLPHIGEVRARRLITTFKDNLADVLSDSRNLGAVAAALDPYKPLFASKLAANIYAVLAARDAQHLSVADELRFLQKLEKLGVTDARAVRSLWRLMGGVGAMDRLLRNPYLAASLMSWTKADHLGRALLKERMDKSSIARHPDRLLGSIDSAWRDILIAGDTAATPALFRATLEKKGVYVDDALALGIKRRHIVVSNRLYRAPGAAWLENTLVESLLAMEETPSPINTEDLTTLTTAVASAESSTGLTLHSEQRAAVKKLLMLQVGVLQGGAGVGKTTVMKVLTAAWEQLGGNVLMGALAGKAALQLSRSTSTVGKPRLAYTLARMLRMFNAPSSDTPTIDGKTLLILDEASMIDTPSLRQIVSLLPAEARLLLVGDFGQLPPVGIGCVFHDLVKDATWVVTLTTVLRQAHNSPVPSAAMQVRNGQLPELKPWTGEDDGIFWQDTSKIHELYADLKSRSNDVMVVAARRATVTSFNEAAAARQRIEAGITESTVRLGPLASVAVGDPVVCTQNRYKDALFNGLLGRVTEARGTQVSVLWDGESESRPLSKEIGADIELAYAVTCHRAQGSSAEYVIVFVEDSPLVTREWLYTAITRTRKTVILVGSKIALQKAVQRRSDRQTGFTIDTTRTDSIYDTA